MRHHVDIEVPLVLRLIIAQSAREGAFSSVYGHVALEAELGERSVVADGASEGVFGGVGENVALYRNIETYITILRIQNSHF